jgi:hypothetical protein
MRTHWMVVLFAGTRVGNLGVLIKMVRKSKMMARHKISLYLTISLCAALPALAEVDLSGSWSSKNHEDALERGWGPHPADWTGIPFNDSGRARALSYSQSTISMPERICWFNTQWSIAGAMFSIKIWNENEPLTGKIVAWVIGGWESRAAMTIWMDGRPHPSKNAPHDHTGFTTGSWNGDVLTAYTTHIKSGNIRRNGALNSDEATITMTFIRHDDMLTLAAVMEDPVYLSEPFIVTRPTSPLPRPLPSRVRPASLVLKAWSRAGFRTICLARILSSMKWKRSTTFPGKPRSAERTQCIRNFVKKSRISS